MKPLTPSIPHVIILLGIPGAGKTHFAEHFAKMFHAPYINVKAIRTIAKTSDEAALTLSSLMLDELLKTQRTIIYEGPTQNRVFRQSLYKQVADAGYKPLLVWVQTESNEAMRRATKKGSDLNPEAFNQAVTRFHTPIAIEKPVVISGKHTYTTQVKIVLKHLAGVRPTGEIKPESRPRSGGRSIILR